MVNGCYGVIKEKSLIMGQWNHQSGFSIGSTTYKWMICYEIILVMHVSKKKKNKTQAHLG